MKQLKYGILQITGHDGTPELAEKRMPWSEAAEEIVKGEAYNGIYTIEDDGQEAPVTTQERIAELEEAMDLLLSGVTE